MNRFYHVRAPLMIQQFIGNKEVMPAVVPELANSTGGCTIYIEDYDSEYVRVQVAWCRYTDSYSRKLGRKTAKEKEPTLVPRVLLEKELEGIEEQMLKQSCWPTRHDEQLLKDCLGDWSRAAQRHFMENKVATPESHQG